MRIHKSRTDKVDYIHTYCEENWQSCVYADRLNQIYEETENMTEQEQRIALLENEINSLKANNHSLLSENGRLKSEIQKMDQAAEHNYKLYQKKKDDDAHLIKILRAEAQWAESIAALYLVKANGAMDFEIPRSELTDSLQKYLLSFELDQERDVWKVRVTVNEEEQV